MRRVAPRRPAETAADAAQGAAGAAAGQAATAQAATEIAEGAMEATRNVATTALDAAKDTLANGDARRPGRALPSGISRRPRGCRRSARAGG